MILQATEPVTMGLRRKSGLQGLPLEMRTYRGWWLWSGQIHVTLKMESLQSYETLKYYTMQEAKTRP